MVGYPTEGGGGGGGGGAGRATHANTRMCKHLCILRIKHYCKHREDLGTLTSIYELTSVGFTFT